MTKPIFHAMPESHAGAIWAGGLDANGQRPERHLSQGDGIPCRHCLEDIPAGEAYLILAYRPFPAPQPYAEVGPIFLHAEPCRRHAASGRTPAMLLRRESMLVKGYGPDDRIVYGTGRVVPTADLARAAAEILAAPEVAYVHARSARNNCYQCRIDRE